MAHLVIKPRENAGERPGVERPHLAQDGSHRFVDLQQIEADGIPVKSHRRQLRRGTSAHLMELWLTDCEFSRVPDAMQHEVLLRRAGAHGSTGVGAPEWAPALQRTASQGP